MAVNMQEHVHNILLYLIKDSDAAQCPIVKHTLDAAMDCLEFAYNIYPDYKGVENMDQTQIASAIRSFDQIPAVEYPSSDPDELNWRGDRLRHQRMFVQAIEEYSRAIELNPTHPIYFYNRAIAYCHLKIYDMCIDDCFSAIKLDSTIGGVWGCLGFAYYENCNFLEAREAFLEAIKRIPTNTSYRMYLEKVDRRLCNNVVDPEPGPSGTCRSHPLNQSAKNVSDSDDEYEYVETLTQQLTSFVLDDDDPPYFKLPTDDSDL